MFNGIQIARVGENVFNARFRGGQPNCLEKSDPLCCDYIVNGGRVSLLRRPGKLAEFVPNKRVRFDDLKADAICQGDKPSTFILHGAALSTGRRKLGMAA
jgi:hypothetical protein